VSLSQATVEKIQDYARRYPSAQSAILPALWAVQHEVGYVTTDGMREVAQHLGLPASLVEATSSFYSMYLTKPEGRHDAVMCVNVACALRGAEELFAYCEQRLGIKDGQTTSDGAITLRSTIECLGACGGAPMMQIDHRFEEDLTPERVNAIFERLRTEPAPSHEPPQTAAVPAATAAAPAAPKRAAGGSRPGAKKADT
jgi:NADH-quinone oxidoreductase subunit E